MEADVADTTSKILEQAQKISAEGKGRLVNKLLSGTGLSVVLGNNQLRSSVIGQINMMSRDDLVELLHAIADRITTEGK